MPEFRHYATFDEAMAILRDVCAAHALKLIPEQPVLTEPTLETFASFVPEVEARLAKYGVVHLEGEFTTYPLQFQRRESGAAAGTYYIDTAVGPRLHWTLPSATRQSPPRLGPGSLGYVSSYRDPSGQRSPPSPALIAAFRAVVKTMKHHMTTVTAGSEKVWIGRETLRRRDAGELVINL